MSHRVICIALSSFLLTIGSACWAENEGFPSEVNRFLATRKVLASVDFPADSSALTAAGRAALRAKMAQIKKAYNDKLVVRLEGFIGNNDTSPGNSLLAMNRAKAVGTYLRAFQGVEARYYVTGFDGSELVGEKPARVDVVVYSDILKMNSAPVAESVTSLP